MEQSQQLHLRPGEEYLVRLPGLGTVGYEWTISVEGDEAAVTIAETAAEPPSSGDVPGKSRDEVYVLTARQPGHAVVRFMQRRPFEPDRPPRDEREFGVQVD